MWRSTTAAMVVGYPAVFNDWTRIADADGEYVEQIAGVPADQPVGSRSACYAVCRLSC